MALMPVVFAVPCCCCGAPGQLCQCGWYFCSHCSHECRTAAEYEDSVQEDTQEPDDSMGSTGSTSDTDMDFKDYATIASMCQNDEVWSKFQDGLYVKTFLLPEISACSVIEKSISRHFGRLGDWVKAVEYMSWDKKTFVVINVSHRKSYVIDVGQKPVNNSCQQALRYLHSNTDTMGFVVDGDTIVHLDVCTQNYGKITDRRAGREKLLMAAINTNDRIEFAW